MNIKILLDMLVKKGLVKGREERNRILAEMTDDVAALVLADNAGQALALSLDGTAQRAAATRSSWPSSTTWRGPAS